MSLFQEITEDNNMFDSLCSLVLILISCFESSSYVVSVDALIYHDSFILDACVCLFHCLFVLFSFELIMIKSVSS